MFHIMLDTQKLLNKYSYYYLWKYTLMKSLYEITINLD